MREPALEASPLIWGYNALKEDSAENQFPKNSRSTVPVLVVPPTVI
jgi:hypothetical protein